MMRQVLWGTVEAIVVVAIGAGVWFGPRTMDWAMGYPPADERLILSAGDTTPHGRQEFETALAAGACIQHRDESGRTALMYAAMGGDVATVQRLLDLGADVDAVDAMGNTAVDLAAKNGRQDVVELLEHHSAAALLE